MEGTYKRSQNCDDGASQNAYGTSCALICPAGLYVEYISWSLAATAGQGTPP